VAVVVLAEIVVAARTSAASPETSAPVETISLPAALSQAVRGNLQLRRARAQIRHSEADLMSARGSFDIVVEASTTYSRRVTPRVSVDDLSGGNSDQNTYRLQLGRRLETGGKLTLGVNGAASTTDSVLDCGLQADGRACVLHNMGATLALTQPLLAGGIAVATSDVRRREVQRDVAAVNRIASAAVVVRDVVIAYGQLAYAHRVLAIQRAALELAREQLRNNEKQVSVGKLAPIEVAAAEQAVSGTELLVLSAEEEVINRTLALRELLGSEAPIPTTWLATEDPPLPLPPSLSEAALVERALAYNPQLQALRMGRKLNDVDQRVARSLLWPTLDLEASLSTIGRATEPRQALRQTGAFENTAWLAGLNFAFPVQNRVARGRAEAVRIEAEELEIDLEAQSRQIRSQALRLLNSVRSGGKRIEFARKTVAFAEMNLKAERGRFSLGQASNNDVLRVQQELKQAQLTVASATLELLADQASLAALTGQILAEHGIALGGLE
jgi:outer membrane protein